MQYSRMCICMLKRSAPLAQMQVGSTTNRYATSSLQRRTATLKEYTDWNPRAFQAQRLARGPQSPSHPTLHVTHTDAPQPCQALLDVTPRSQRNLIDVSWAPLCADDQDCHAIPASCSEPDHLQIQRASFGGTLQAQRLRCYFSLGPEAGLFVASLHHVLVHLGLE